jgi:hypothetical protein
MKNLVSAVFCAGLMQITFAQEKNIDKYIGELENNLMHGFGLMEYANGTMYQGNFQYGKPHGLGTYVDVDGNQKTGIYEKGKFVSDYNYPDSWHVYDIYYDFEMNEGEKFSSYSIDIELFDEVGDTSNLYIAPFGIGEINGVQFYGGIQTNCGGYKDANHKKNNTPFTAQGRSIIFSRWNETNSEAIKMDPNGVCEVGDEGDFLSVRNAFKWGVGKYTMTIYATDEKVTINDIVHTWVGMKIYDHQNNQTVNAGYLAFPGEELFLKNELEIFTQTYYESKKLDAMPKISMEFSNFLFNDKPVEPYDPTAYYSYDLPHFGNAFWKGKSIHAFIGKFSPRRSICFLEEGLLVYLKDY